jgi:hypothetical protein
VASIIEVEKEEDLPKVLDQIADPVGTFYRFSLADSLLQQAAQRNAPHGTTTNSREGGR